MVLSLSWIMEPFQKQTSPLVGKLQLLPLFLFRMLAWVVIVVSLKSLASAVLFISVMVNFAILYGKSDQLFETAMLSILFPALKFPALEMSEQNKEKAFFWLSMTGNVVLMMSMAAILSLYLSDVMNPWCLTDQILVPEEMLAHICLLMVILFIASTFPISLAKYVEKPRQGLIDI